MRPVCISQCTELVADRKTSQFEQCANVKFCQKLGKKTHTKHWKCYGKYMGEYTWGIVLCLSGINTSRLIEFLPLALYTGSHKLPLLPAIASLVASCWLYSVNISCLMTVSCKLGFTVQCYHTMASLQNFWLYWYVCIYLYKSLPLQISLTHFKLTHFCIYSLSLTRAYINLILCKIFSITFIFFRYRA